MTAMEKLTQLLLDYGLSEHETHILLAQFLQEEAPKFIEYMALCGISADDIKELYEERVVS